MNILIYSVSDLFPRTEVGLSSTPCVKDIYGESISMFRKPVFSSFLGKPVFNNNNNQFL